MSKMVDESGQSSGFDRSPAPPTQLVGPNWHSNAGALLGVIEYMTEVTGESLDDEDAAMFAQIDAEWKAALVSPPEKHNPALSKWSGWDQSNLPWSEAKHKDAVCYAAFGQTWSMEDAAELIGFIDRTWPRAALATSTDGRDDG